MSDWYDRLEKDGHALLIDVFTPAELESAKRTVAALLDSDVAGESLVIGRGSPASGLRNLIEFWPGIVNLVRQSPLGAAIHQILGPGAGLVRGLYFDKPPGHSWALPWHRDLTIAVKRHGSIGRFRKPTLKAGGPHVEAPREVLAAMVTARIHLDAMIDANGPLRVLPGSHLEESPNREAVIVHCDAGDVFLMRPLLAHSSAIGEANHPGHRRVIHLEFAPSAELPDDYQWHDFIAIR